MNDRKFIVMSADALVTEDLELLKTQPNYKRYVEGGARMESMLSVYPSVTYPAHPSMATGCLPGKTGILSNCEKLDPSADALPWVLDHKFVKVPDIFTAAKRAGRSTAAVFWPVTGNHPDIDYLINEWPGCAEDVPIERALASQGTSPEVMDIVRKYAREMPRTGIHPDCDYFIADCAAEIIRRHQPDLMMIHPANVDGARHGYGVFAKEVEDAVRDTDDMIGIVCRAAEAAGLKDKFNFILVSDHGQMDMKRVVNTNTLFADLGWIETDDKGRVKSWRAKTISSAFSSYVFLKDPSDEKFRQEVARTLAGIVKDGLYGFGAVLDEKEARERYGLYGDFSFVIETDDFTGFGDDVSHPTLARCRDMSDYRQGWASHGYMPEKGPQPVFCAKGPSFRKNFLGGRGSICDLAPTLAAAMDIPFPDCDGRALWELLAK